MGVSQNRFRMTFAGYDRVAVDSHMTALEEQNRAMATDVATQSRRADALAAELAELRDAHEALKRKFDRVCRTPIESDGLSERMLRMVELAHVEAAEIVQDARTRADRTRAAADEDARRMRRRYEVKLAELDDRRAQLEAEFAEHTRANQEEFDERERVAAERRRRLDEQSQRRRQESEQELGKALAARRAAAERSVRRREAEAAERAEATIAEARDRAAEMVARATARVSELEDVQRTLTARLRETRAILSAVGDPPPPDPASAAAGDEDLAGVMPEQRGGDVDPGDADDEPRARVEAEVGAEAGADRDASDARDGSDSRNGTADGGGAAGRTVEYAEARESAAAEDDVAPAVGADGPVRAGITAAAH